jgi:drug/metabolite transporter (DMT)-like permease
MSSAKARLAHFITSAQQPIWLGGYVIAASLLPIMQRYLTFYFDPMTLSFVRHVAGSIVLLTIAVIVAPQGLRDIFALPRRFMGLVFLGLMYSIAVGLFIAGLSRTSAVMSSLIALLGLPLTVVLLMAAFPDERRRARGRAFYVGAAMSFAASAALALSNGIQGAQDAIGTACLIGSALIQASAAIFTKRMVLAFHPLCLGAVNGAIMAFFFGVGTLLWGDLARVTEVPPAVDALLIFSGVYGLLVGGVLYLANMKRFGMVVTRLAELSTPVLTGLFGFLFFGERLTPTQVALGLVLIAGCMLILSSNRAKPAAQQPDQQG